jgi:hypothetical protein
MMGLLIGHSHLKENYFNWGWYTVWGMIDAKKGE